MVLIKKILTVFPFLVLVGKTLFWVPAGTPIFDLLAFFFFSVWVIWICVAFSYDKDVPAYSGNFKFEKGENQAPRAIFTVIMVSLQFIVAMVL